MKSIRRRTIAIAAAAAGVLLVASFAGIGVWTAGLNAETARVERIVDALETPVSWGFPDVRLTPAQPFCIGGSPCPSAFLVWVFDGAVERDDLLAVLDSAKLDFPILGDCVMDDEQDVWPASICEASGVRDGVRSELAFSVDGNTGRHSLIVNVETVAER